MENEDPTLFKRTTTDDESKELKHKTERNDHENILKSLNFDKGFFEKKSKALIKKKISFLITETFLGTR